MWYVMWLCTVKVSQLNLQVLGLSIGAYVNVAFYRTHNTKINFSAYFHKALYRKRICATTFRPYIAIVCVMVRINTLLRKYFSGKNDYPLNISESHGHNNSSLLWDYSIW